MKNLRFLLPVSIGILAVVLWLAAAVWPSTSWLLRPAPLSSLPGFSVPAAPQPAPPAAPVAFVGPRQNIPDDAPGAYGFWSLAMPVTGVLSRSGQPLMSEFTWLKAHGWKGVVDLRAVTDHGQSGDDAHVAGFSQLGFAYLYLPMTDGAAPTDEQAQQFLDFVQNPAHQPVHVHCRGGYGRTGTLVALYRYQVQGWPMEKAIEESRLFHGGVSAAQKTWLLAWAAEHPH